MCSTYFLPHCSSYSIHIKTVDRSTLLTCAGSERVQSFIPSPSINLMSDPSIVEAKIQNISFECDTSGVKLKDLLIFFFCDEELCTSAALHGAETERLRRNENAAHNRRWLKNEEKKNPLLSVNISKYLGEYGCL